MLEEGMKFSEKDSRIDDKGNIFVGLRCKGHSCTMKVLVTWKLSLFQAWGDSYQIEYAKPRLFSWAGEMIGATFKHNKYELLPEWEDLKVDEWMVREVQGRIMQEIEDGTY